VFKTIRTLTMVVIVSVFLLAAGGYGGYEILNWYYKQTKVPPQVSTNDLELVENETAQKCNAYSIKAELFPDEAVLKVRQTISFVNMTGVDQREVFFNIYPNAYKKRSTAPIVFDSFKQVYPEGFNQGGIDINMVNVDGDKAGYQILKEDETLLVVELGRVAHTGESAVIDIDYDVKLPKTRNRLGHYNGYYNFGNWYPILCVFEPQKGWVHNQFYSVGEPFYSEPADYRIEITTPKDFVLAATSSAYNITELEQKKVWHYGINNIRDFAWVASPNLDYLEKEVDGVKIYSYFDKDNRVMGSRALGFALSAVKVYNKEIGDYPYQNISLVETEFPSAMEYPNLIMLSRKFYETESEWDDLEKKVVHEIAHQWWYNSVGNNQYEEPWIDEGLATYSQILYFENVYGAKYADVYYKELVLSGYNHYHRQEFLKPVSQSRTWSEYYLRAYYYPVVMLQDLRQRMGDEMFFKFIHKLFKGYCFKNLSREDFINTVKQFSDFNSEDFIRNWFTLQ
jgi:aminopeptidase N